MPKCLPVFLMCATVMGVPFSRTLPAGELVRFEKSQRHMGTAIGIVLYADSPIRAEQAFAAGFAVFAKIDEVGSDYNADSELSRLGLASPTAKPVRVSDDLWPLLVESQRFARESEGAFDITVGPLTRLWRRARRQKEIPAADELQSALAATGWKNLVLDPQTKSASLLKPGMRLDLGGIAQGYAAEQALAAVRKCGVSRALVDASGDVALGDPPPDATGWKVALAPLSGKGDPELFLNIANQAVVTSGDAYQAVEIAGRRYSHIVDPHTGLGLQQRSQVTVIAPRATIADALATAVSVLGPERGVKLLDQFPSVEARIICQTVEREIEETITEGFEKWIIPRPELPASSQQEQ